MITGDVETPRQVEAEMAGRDEAREVLGFDPLTEIQRRRERSGVYFKIVGFSEGEDES